MDVDKRVSYVPVSDENVFRQFPQLDPVACATRVHYVREDGAVLTGGEVITELVAHMPGAGKLAWLLETEVGKKVADFFYRHVEEARQRLKEADEACDRCPSEKR